MENYLTETEIAEAGQDLTSWLLQDEQFLSQDFCNMAKKAQSHVAGVPDYIFPPSPESDQPLESFLELDDGIFGDTQSPQTSVAYPENLSEVPKFNVTDSNDLDIQALMKQEISQQQQLDQLQFMQEQAQQEALFRQQQEDAWREKEQKLLQQQLEQERQDQLLLESSEVIMGDDGNAYLYIKDEEMAVDDSVSSSEHNLNSSHENSGYIVDGLTGSGELDLPFIISVPVHEAVQPVSSNEQISIVSSDTCPDNKDKKPFVIKLKTVTIPNKTPEIVLNSTDDFSIVEPQPTLKDLLSADSADDMITEFINTPPSPPPSISTYNSPSSSSGSFSPTSNVDYSSSEEMDTTPPKKKKGPYSLAERRLRKKEQNKRAALRYRQKKKEEEDVILIELKKEEKKYKFLLEEKEKCLVEFNVMAQLARDYVAAHRKYKS